ncbi:putative GDP/GTP exchange factor Sec2p [Talaromyces proteolyticus]|uniref:GDP/GTP exchange factor Sec2p n=1 Tax=Talaromyces proteolyticus TaxID=1131652 RepID=A0AAD4Q512_9EURO|nr:putative GDP/GTP exchange factor Sec2p [Talaromyces proteolyticus]KAH8703821.1 putative GDP/GTP exchange factor Sec2p [Talaromyces proteolyticus]
MADLISIHTYGHSNFLSTSSMMSRPSNHKRSQSADKRSLSPARFITKMKSTNALSDMKNARRLSPAGLEDVSESNFNTLRDPRMASTSDLSLTVDSTHHPDLNSEVATLSAKLVQAINNQTLLDDSLSDARQELEAAQDRLLIVESENQQFRTDLSSGILVRRSDVESEILAMKNSLEEERERRTIAEKEKKEMDQELENLTAALFEEANKMVAAAKQEREAIEKKNEQLRAQIKDTEALVASQKEQLAELKEVMQEMNSVRGDTDTTPNTSTAPSSPAVAMQANLSRLLDTSNISPVSAAAVDISPAPSTSFCHLLKPIYRTDMIAYDDFRDLLLLAKASKPPSRVASGSYGGLNVMGLAGLTGGGNANISTVALNSGNNRAQTPNGSPQPSVSHTPLKDTRFYKRVLTEDLEPSLRLDAAPSISWLTRRSVFSSICDGGLIVEPMPASSRKFKFSCSLCGERRQSNENERTHRFRTSESETAPRYALCILCLEKVRACCELTGYLRMILDGHVHVADDEEEKEAWEETIRLRERLFWSRLGGGVVPSFISTDEPEKVLPVPVAASNPTDSETDTIAQPSVSVGTATDHEVPRSLPPKDDVVEEDPFKSDVKRVSIGGTIISTDVENQDAALKEGDSCCDEVEDLSRVASDPPHSNTTAEHETMTQPDQSKPTSEKSTSIPGAFDQW